MWPPTMWWKELSSCAATKCVSSIFFDLQGRHDFGQRRGSQAHPGIMPQRERSPAFAAASRAQFGLRCGSRLIGRPGGALADQIRGDRQRAGQWQTDVGHGTGEWRSEGRLRPARVCHRSPPSGSTRPTAEGATVPPASTVAPAAAASATGAAAGGGIGFDGKQRRCGRVFGDQRDGRGRLGGRRSGACHFSDGCHQRAPAAPRPQECLPPSGTAVAAASASGAAATTRRRRNGGQRHRGGRCRHHRGENRVSRGPAAVPEREARRALAGVWQCAIAQCGRRGVLHLGRRRR